MSGKREEIAKALVVTAEVLGHELSPAAALVMGRQLDAYEPADVAKALRRCQRELRGRLSLADVLSRIPGRHIGAEEAWSLCPRSEDQTVVWTPEIARAWGVARALLEEGDRVGARMAFKEAYSEAVATAEHAPRWEVSLGHDPQGRRAAIQAAVEAGRLSASVAEQHIGHLPGSETENLLGDGEAVDALARTVVRGMMR